MEALTQLDLASSLYFLAALLFIAAAGGFAIVAQAAKSARGAVGCFALAILFFLALGVLSFGAGVAHVIAAG